MRIDKWLWTARFFKTRSLATEAVLAGHVQVDGKRVKPAREVRVGETLEIRRSQVAWTVEVRALAERRGPASEAATLYEETKESQEAREQQRLERGSRNRSAPISAPARRNRTGGASMRFAAAAAGLRQIARVPTDGQGANAQR